MTKGSKTGQAASDTDTVAGGPGDDTITAPETGADQWPHLSEKQERALDRDRDGVPGGSLPEKTTYLTIRHSDGYGPKGRFLDLTDDEAKAGLPQILRPATAAEIARRRS